jgi:hypothetical protein
MKVRRFLLFIAMLVSMVVMSHSVAFAQGIQLFAVLLGGNEVSNATPPQADVGDQNGSGSATVILIPQTTTICFAVLVNGITTPVAAHIHRGTAGQNGPIVVDFTPDIPAPAPVPGSAATSSGCKNITAGLLDAIRNTPSRYYVNVHTNQFPGGAIRGQLF